MDLLTLVGARAQLFDIRALHVRVVLLATEEMSEVHEKGFMMRKR